MKTRADLTQLGSPEESKRYIATYNAFFLYLSKTS